MKRILFLALLLIVAASAGVAKDIKESRVPDKVRAYVTLHYPGATDREWDLKNKNNQTYYKVEFEIGGREVELELTPEGELLRSEEELPVTDYPAFVQNYINNNYTNGVILGVKKKTAGGTVTYNAGIRYYNKKGYERHVNISFANDGSVMKK